MNKTTVVLNKLDLEGIVGNKSQFIRDAIKDKLLAQSSSISNLNVRITEVKGRRGILRAQLVEVDKQLSNLKEHKKYLKKEK